MSPSSPSLPHVVTPSQCAWKGVWYLYLIMGNADDPSREGALARNPVSEKPRFLSSHFSFLFYFRTETRPESVPPAFYYRSHSMAMAIRRSGQSSFCHRPSLPLPRFRTFSLTLRTQQRDPAPHRTPYPRRRRARESGNEKTA